MNAIENKRKYDQSYAAAMKKDETADWDMGSRGILGNSHPFRDAIQTTVDELQQHAGQGNANVDHRLKEYKQLAKMYNDEVGYFGEGDFSNKVRNQVMHTQQRLAQLKYNMSKPENQQNPEAMRELQSELQRHSQRLNDFKTWGRASTR